jgi:transcriptional regulator with XRE-family HTH domain
VELIRSIYGSARATMQELADRFGVSRALVSLIVRNKIWVSA